MRSLLSCVRSSHVEESGMDIPKPLSYQSQKCIMQHMDVNKRFLYASYLPSLRNIHKAAPLRIDVLKLEPASFTVNYIKYSFASIIEKNSEKGHQPLKNMKWTNYVEGLPFDVDKFGVADMDEVLAQGDISVEVQRKDYLEKRNAALQAQCFVYSFSLMNALEDYDIDPQQANEKYEETSKKLLDTILEINGGKSGDDPEYPNCIYCTVTNNRNDAKQSLRLPDSLKIRDVLRQQIQNFLSGRRVLQVKRLEIDNKTGIWRLPHQIKFQIQELGVRDFANAMIESVMPMLENASFPLKNLSVEVHDSDDSVFQNEILKASESLNITCDAEDFSWANVLINLTNKEIHLSGEKISLEDIAVVARNWIESSRSIGSKFSTDRISEEIFSNEFKEQLGAVEAQIPESANYVQGLTVPMNLTSELNLYCSKSPNYEEEMIKDDGKPWMFVIEVMAIGSAKPMDFVPYVDVEQR